MAIRYFATNRALTDLGRAVGNRDDRLTLQRGGHYFVDMDRYMAHYLGEVEAETMPIEAIGFAFMHGLLGAGDARRVMGISVGTQWLLFLPLAFVIGPLLGFGLLGVWLWQGVTRTVQAWLFLTMWRSRRWQQIEL